MNEIEDLFLELDKDPEYIKAEEELMPGYLITRLRLKRNLTQKGVAKLVGIDKEAIAELEETNNPDINLLRDVARALGAELKITIEEK